jgi:hypothetical protein
LADCVEYILKNSQPNKKSFESLIFLGNFVAPASIRIDIIKLFKEQKTESLFLKMSSRQVIRYFYLQMKYKQQPSYDKNSFMNYM